ncbi:Gfo/Idh/MocA family protein [Persicitalea jodogahamensis]|uniref:Dehydrogenase n=1 Tax=Persicitalea jodogahamensis TaxID=402147 RepID=A0A8J3D3G1_9BACT|nr:Gfo/Idh/MocA family oxidoreductase [Persicitalea jodogahamensis]GHB67779.1 dehydrogenase [Persicitalea jodogahamensis]
MQNENQLNRRSFIKNSAGVAVALSLPTIIPARAFGANDRVSVAVLGVHGRGQNHISGFSNLKNVEVATLCDPDNVVLQKRAGEFEKKYSKKVKTEMDLRKVFDDKSIDAVSIAMPNHWHALATIWACQAGKDVYVEKPGSHDFAEGPKIIEAAKKYKRVVQHGVQLRSSEAMKEAVKHLRDGLIGDVYMARGLVFKWRPDLGDKGTSPVPEGLDYDLWTGPAQMKPFSENYVHYNWHWYWNYGNGDIGNQGIHETDLCMWGLGVDTFPEKITSGGGKFLWKDAQETPEVLSSTYIYPDQRKIIEFEVRPWMTNEEGGTGIGNIFYGSEGYMVVKGYDFYETFLGRDRKPGPTRKAGGDHFKNFIDAVVARDPSKLNGPPETLHLSSGLAHLGNIAYRTGRSLTFDPKKEKFVNDKEADAMLSREYRAPFTMPRNV